MKFADDTTVIDLVRHGDKSEHAQQYRDDSGPQEEPLNTAPLTIPNSTVSAVETFRFLGSTISQDLKWASNIDTIIKKAQQRMYFLCQLRKFNLPQGLLIQFYSAIIQCVLCTSLSGLDPTGTDYNGQWTAERNHWCQPALHSGLLHVQSQETGNITADPS